METRPFVFAVFYLAVGLVVAEAIIFLCWTVPVRKEVWFCIILAAATFMMRALFVLLVPTEPISDFGHVYAVAKAMAEGTATLNGRIYFEQWAYQSGMVLWMALWARLFGAGVGFFQTMNCLCGAGSAVLVYALARRFASSQRARTAGLFYLFYPTSILLSPVLTNQHLSELLLLGALYVTTEEDGNKKGQLLRGGIAGLLLAFSNVIRPTAIVAVLAVLAVLILELLRWKGLGSTGLLPTAGGYSAADAQIVFASDRLADIQEASRRLLGERLAALIPGQFLPLFWEKIKGMWGKFEPTWWTLTQNVTDIYAARGQGEVMTWTLEKFRRLASGLSIVESLLIAAGCGQAALKKGKGREAALLFTLTALAYFCAHLLIEIQSRYRTLLFAVTLPLTAIAADWMTEAGRKLLACRREKGKEIRP